jgi:hypothetical protein
LAFAPQQQIARARISFDQLLVYQLLIALQNREVIDPIFGCAIAHGGQRIAFLENSSSIIATTRSRSWREIG